MITTKHTSSQANGPLTSNISKFPIHWLIKICQFLDEKDLYHFETTCRSIRKAAVDPNAFYEIKCNVFDYFNKYARNQRFNKVQSIVIMNKKRNYPDGFPSYNDIYFADAVNKFPNLRTLTVSIKSLSHYGYEFKPFNMFLQELCKLLAIPRDHDKLAFSISVINSASDFMRWSLYLFDSNKNSMISKVLLNIDELTFNIGWNVKCLDQILSTIESLKMNNKKFQTIRCHIYYYVDSMVQEPDNEHFWNQLRKLKKYCVNLQMFVKYNYYQHTSYKTCDWEEFVAQLMQSEMFEIFQIEITFSSSQEFINDFRKHLDPWLKINVESMRTIRLKHMCITMYYPSVDRNLKMKLLESIKKFCQECNDSNRMVEHNLDMQSKPHHRPLLRYTVEL
eukprot:68479_1